MTKQGKGKKLDNNIKYNDYLDLINTQLDKYLSSSFLKNQTMLDSMKYSVSAGGKRIRPVLLLEFCRILGGDIKSAIPFACAVEMIHSSSLIHDDLPCMDDDDFRRGKPSCHKQFDEATALLAGDALIIFAFNIMAIQNESLDPKLALRAIYELSEQTGVNGMIGGQVLDLASENKIIGLNELKTIHNLKTGALISCCCKIGAIIANATEEQIKKAGEFGLLLGLAFQVIDDILDYTSTTEELGKPVGSDQENNKSTFVSLYGLEKSIKYADETTNKAIEIINSFEDNYFLLDLTKQLLNRRR